MKKIISENYSYQSSIQYKMYKVLEYKEMP